MYSRHCNCQRLSRCNESVRSFTGVPPSGNTSENGIAGLVHSRRRRRQRHAHDQCLLMQLHYDRARSYTMKDCSRDCKLYLELLLVFEKTVAQVRIYPLVENLECYDKPISFYVQLLSVLRQLSDMVYSSRSVLFQVGRFFLYIDMFGSAI